MAALRESDGQIEKILVILAGWAGFIAVGIVLILVVLWRASRRS
jgi:hypothetical protein